MIEVKVRHNEPIDRAIKRLKKVMDREGILRELKERKYFMKPSEHKRKKSARARARRKKEQEDS
jgi:small subunit ribosomal protein S21